jgi:hypothetical protein
MKQNENRIFGLFNNLICQFKIKLCKTPIKTTKNDPSQRVEAYRYTLINLLSKWDFKKLAIIEKTLDS